MPVYEYRCEACDALTESIRPMRDADAPMRCESCGSEKTQRVHSVFMAAAGAKESGSSASPGGCCPCGKNAGACGMN